jgi:excisionase family DNA binding protein
VTALPDNERSPRVERRRGLMSAHDVAAMLGVPVSWVYAQTRAGRIPTVPLGRYYRYRADAIDAWIANLEAGHTGAL